MKNFFRDWGNLLSFFSRPYPDFPFVLFSSQHKSSFLCFCCSCFMYAHIHLLNIKQFLDSKEITASSIEFLRCINDRILCKPNNLISHNSIVSFYELSDGFEKLIAYRLCRIYKQ